MSTIRERILEFIDYKKISNREFNRIIGVSPGFLGSNSDIGSKVVSKIMDNFPEISLMWLISGKGDMLNKNVNHQLEEPQTFNYLIQTNKNLSESMRQLTETNAQLVKKMQEDVATAPADGVLVTEGHRQKTQKH